MLYFFWSVAKIIQEQYNVDYKNQLVQTLINTFKYKNEKFYQDKLENKTISEQIEYLNSLVNLILAKKQKNCD